MEKSLFVLSKSILLKKYSNMKEIILQFRLLQKNHHSVILLVL